MKKLVYFLTIVILAACLPLIHAEPEDFKIVDAYWNAPPIAGAPNILTVKIEYIGSDQVENITATLRLLDVAGTDLEASDSYNGSVTSGLRIEFSFNFTIPEGAKASYYKAVLDLEYFKNSVLTSESLMLQVGFLGSPLFSISSNKNTLTRGKTEQVKLSIKVEETPARNVEVRVTPASPFITVIGGNLERRGIVEAGTVLELDLKFMVDSNAGDSIAITVTISYSDFSRTPSTTTETIGFKVSGYSMPKLEASLTPRKIVSGKTTTMYVLITNAGGSTAKQVYATISPISPGVAILHGSSQNLGDIPPGSSRSFSIIVRADRGLSGTASLLLTLTYLDESDDFHTVTLNLGFEILRAPIPVLLVSTEDNVLFLGKEKNLTLIISNIGEGEAKDIVLDVLSGQGFMVLSNSRFLIGELEPGETEQVKLKVFASPAFRESSIVNLKLRYYDEYGEEYSDILNLAFKVEEPGKPLLELKPLNLTLFPNQVNKIYFEVLNNGQGPARNVSISFASPSPEIASLVGISTHTLEEIKPNQTVILEYKIFVQPRVYGAIQLLASLSYQDEYENYYNRIMGVGFKVEGVWELSVLQVKTSPAVLFPGDKMVKLIITLSNTGDYMAKNVNLTLIGGKYVKPSTLTTSIAYLPYLPVGEAASIIFLVDISETAPPGNHEVVIKADEREIIFRLTVFEKAVLEVSNVTKLYTYPGERGYRIILNVKNLSNYTVEDVRVDLYSPFITGTTSARIGEMLPGEERLVVFEVDVDELTPIGVLPVDTRISWNQEGRMLSESSKLYINIYEKKIPFLFYAAIFTVIIGAVLLLARKTTLISMLKERIRSKA